MKIQWEKVTWYSKAVAVIFFVGIFVFGYYIGRLSVVAVQTDTATLVPAVPFENLVVFVCKDNKSMAADFKDKIVALSLSDGRKMTLPQVISASGARYANTDESFVFWNKGNGAFVTEGNKTTFEECITKN